MSSYKRVAITGDTFRAHSRADKALISSNIDLFAHFVAPPLRRAGADVSVITDIKTDERTRKATQHRFGLARDVHSWAIRSQILSPSVKRYFDDLFSAYDLIVGFELPFSLVEYCVSNSVPVIDFAFHPVRFLQDLVWMARASPATLFEKVATAQFDFRDWPVSVPIDKARMRARDEIRRAVVEGGTGGPAEVFFIQTRFDRSKLDGNGSIVDDLELILADEIQPTFYRAHPSEPRPEIELALRRKGARLLPASINTYDLLNFCREDISVSSVSSSILAEADLLSVPSVRALVGYPWRIRGFEHLAAKSHVATLPCYIAVDRRTRTDSFWASIVNDDPEPVTATPGLDNGLLRTSWGEYWGTAREGV